MVVDCRVVPARTPTGGLTSQFGKVAVIPGATTSGGGCPASAIVNESYGGELTAHAIVANVPISKCLTLRSTRSRTRAGDVSRSEYARSALRMRPMTTAA